MDPSTSQNLGHTVLRRHPLSRNVVKEFEDSRSFGERLADRIAKFGGSWSFILVFLASLGGWVILNTALLRSRAFDPYPYILLNLFLSMLASLQAPIIMMSQNRQAAKDRVDAAHDYEVNLKAEMEIRGLHEKLDELRERRWMELVDMQQEQIRLLQGLLARVIRSEG
jgi:uncharacterized membrane protein